MDNKEICGKKQVESYLLNQMTEEEETLFQEHLAQCESCCKYLTEIRTLASIVREEDLYMETPFVKRKTNQGLGYWSSVAACILFLIGLSTFWYKKQQVEDMLYPTSIEYKNRASSDKADIQLLFPTQDTTNIKRNQPVVFKWDTLCSFHLKIRYKETTLLDIEGKGTEYTLPTATFTSYPHIYWILTVGEQSHSGQIIFSNN